MFIIKKLKKFQKLTTQTDYRNSELEDLLNKLDNEITSSLQIAEKKCSQNYMNCKLDWSL